ncbi:hypothetical protein U1Q18_017444 [Sarracenia purpurea var. burkii]
MGRQDKRLRNLIGILKDKYSLIKASLSVKRATSSIQVAVIRATTHGSSSPPSEHRVAAVLSLGHGSQTTARRCLMAVVDRLHNTRDAYVALKCLITLHYIIATRSFILKDQLISFYPTAGGRNFLNVSRFRDGKDTETWELSSWVRWYAGVLERNLMASRVLERKGRSPLKSDLMREMEVLVSIVEEICRAPDSLHCQQNNLVYVAVNLIGEDYRSTQKQIQVRLGEFTGRNIELSDLSATESGELIRCLKRLEDCRERLLVVFGNRRRNDSFWESITDTKTKLVKVEEERERGRWLARTGRREDASELTRLGERVVRPSQLLMLPYGGEGLVVDRVHSNSSLV